MKFDKYALKIDDSSLAQIKKYGEKVSYEKEESLVHEGHIPRVGFLILKGPVYLEKGKKRFPIESFNLIGAKELMSNSPCEFSINVMPGAEILSLCRSSLQELQRDDLSFMNLIEQIA